MPLTLIRRPRQGRVLYKEIEKEVRAEMEAIGKEAIQALLEDVKDWESKPTFKAKATMGKTWKLVIRYDRREKIGKIYGWVDEGTGERGNKPGGKAYDITPKRAKAFEFDVPYTPFTLPKKKDYKVHGGGPAHIITKVVHMPGINPRDFTEALRDKLKDRNNPKGFQRRIYNAVRRGLRRVGRSR